MSASPIRIAAVTSVCLLLASGCAGTGKKSKTALPAKQPGEATESAYLTEQQTSDIQLALARLAEQKEQWPQAMTIYRQLLKANPKHPEATHRMAILHARQRQFEQSSEWFQKTLKLKPGDPEVFCDIGYSLASQGRYQEAEINLRQALAIAPAHPRAHNHLGVLLAQQGQPEEAIVAFGRANCSPAQAHLNLAVVLAMNQQMAEARKHLQHAQMLQADDQATQERLLGLAAWIDDRELQPPAASQKAPAAVALAPSKRLSGGREKSSAENAPALTR